MDEEVEGQLRSVANGRTASDVESFGLDFKREGRSVGDTDRLLVTLRRAL